MRYFRFLQEAWPFIICSDISCCLLPCIESWSHGLHISTANSLAWRSFQLAFKTCMVGLWLQTHFSRPQEAVAVRLQGRGPWRAAPQCLVLRMQPPSILFLPPASSPSETHPFPGLVDKSSHNSCRTPPFTFRCSRYIEVASIVTCWQEWLSFDSKGVQAVILHSPPLYSHPDIWATRRLISSRFVWPRLPRIWLPGVIASAACGKQSHTCLTFCAYLGMWTWGLFAGLVGWPYPNYHDDGHNH